MFKLALTLFAVLPCVLGEMVLRVQTPDTVSIHADTDPDTVRVSGVQATGEYACAGTNTTPWREFTPAMVTSAIQDAAARAIDGRTLSSGTAAYPHINSLGGVPHLPAACSGTLPVIYEHPIFTTGLYAGGAAGLDRIFFVWSNTGATGASATLCAVMTHVNAPPGAFTLCQWRIRPTPTVGSLPTEIPQPA